jgi:hypothetical protein
MFSFVNIAFMSVSFPVMWLKIRQFQILLKEDVINFCIHVQLRANIFFNKIKQIRFKSPENRWIFGSSFACFNINIYTKCWKSCQQLQAAPSVALFYSEVIMNLKILYLLLLILKTQILFQHFHTWPLSSCAKCMYGEIVSKHTGNYSAIQSVKTLLNKLYS